MSPIAKHLPCAASHLVKVAFLTSSIALLSLACVSQSAADGSPTVLRLEENLSYGELLVIGEIEDVYLPEFELTWPARIDTGATTTSINATNVEGFERDGDPWVRFLIRHADADQEAKVEKKVERIVKIKNRDGEDANERFVVTMDLTIGDVERRIEVNLADRGDFEFPILIGRNYLAGTALVDVSRDHIQDTPKP